MGVEVGGGGVEVKGTGTGRRTPRYLFAQGEDGSLDAGGCD